MKDKKKVLIIAGVAVAVIAVAGIALWASGIFSKTASAATGITLAQYEQVKRDMPYEEVTAILGEGELDTEEGSFGDAGHTAIYKWQGTQPGSRAAVVFYGGKVASCTQLGLTNTP